MNSPFGVVPTTAPGGLASVLSARQRLWLAVEAARRAADQAARSPAPAPAPPPVRYGRCPPSSTLHCRLYALSGRGDGTFDVSVIGYVVPGGVFRIGTTQVVNVRTDQPGTFGLQAVPMVPVAYGDATGWMPASGIEVLP